MRPLNRSPRRSTVKGAVALLLALALILPGSGSARADQTDPALDALFAELQGVIDPPRAAEITRQIWRAWTRGGSPEIDARMTRAARAMSARDFGTALRQLDRVVALAPEFSEGWNRRATVYYLTGEYRRSLADVARTLALEPRHFGAWSGRGLIHMALAQYPQAIESFQSALQHNPHLQSVQLNLRAAEKELYGEPM